MGTGQGRKQPLQYVKGKHLVQFLGATFGKIMSNEDDTEDKECELFK